MEFFLMAVYQNIILPFEDVTNPYCGNEKFGLQVHRNATKNLNAVQSLDNVASIDHIIVNGLPK